MSGRSLRFAHLFPELLNLYGDSGNVLCLRRRMAWRGIEPVIDEVHMGDTPSFAGVDIAFIGGGSDREQRIVCERLLAQTAPPCWGASGRHCSVGWTTQQATPPPCAPVHR